LVDEEARLLAYLHPSTAQLLISTTEQVLITNHTAAIQNEFQSLLERDRVEDLTRMYAILSRVPPSLDKLRAHFEDHVRKQGLLAVQTAAEAASVAAEASANATPPNEANDDEEGNEPKKKKGKSNAPKGEVDPKVYMEALLAVHKKYSDLAQVAFQGIFN
jgi:cullin 1